MHLYICSLMQFSHHPIRRQQQYVQHHADTRGALEVLLLRNPWLMRAVMVRAEEIG